MSLSQIDCYDILYNKKEYKYENENGYYNEKIFKKIKKHITEHIKKNFPKNFQSIRGNTQVSEALLHQTTNELNDYTHFIPIYKDRILEIIKSNNSPQENHVDKDKLLTLVDNYQLSAIKLEKKFKFAYMNNNFTLIYNDQNITNYEYLCESIKKIKSCMKNSTYNDKTLNQITRVKDARCDTTKMVLMHLMTGQSYKVDMVKETFELVQTIYESTELKLD